MSLRRALEILGLRLRIDEEAVDVTRVEAPQPFEELFPNTRVRDAVADLGALLPEHLKDAPQLPRRRTVRLPRWAMAASLMLVATTAVLATALWVRKPILVTSAGASGARVAEFSLHAGFDFEGAGVPAESRVLDWSSFVVPHEGVGTVVLIERPRGRQLDLCAFGAQGQLLWAARRDWVRWADTLGKPRVGFTSMKSLVTRRRGDTMEETICLVLQRSFQTLVLLVDPLTGQVRSRCFYAGMLGRGVGEVIGTLPDWSEEPRRLLFGGQIGDAETARPTLLMLNVDGSIAQHIVFPTLGFKNAYGVTVEMIHTDWSPDRPEVTVNTSEGFYFSFLVQDRRLDLTGVMAMPGGGLIGEYQIKHGKGSWRAFVNEQGGSLAYARRVAGLVRDEPFEGAQEWRVK